jgi:transcriptional regulator with XRE-family HTH domain
LLLTERIKMLAEPMHMTFASIERDIGIGRGTIRKWDQNCPAADKLLKVANLLNTTMDFLMVGQTSEPSSITITSDDAEWLSLIHSLPPKAKYEFRGELKGYIKRLNEESVAADAPLRTGTDNPK